MVWFQFRRKNSNGAAVSIKEKVEVSQSKFGGLSYWPCCRKPLTEEETQQIKAEVTNHHEGFTVMHEHNCRQPNQRFTFAVMEMKFFGNVTNCELYRLKRRFFNWSRPLY